jgi:hypothetical protein
MCRSRWQLIYKSKDLCANCKKCFKDSGANVPFHKNEVMREGARKCPDCGQPMLSVSSDFRPPRATKTKLWAAIKVLTDAGFTPLPGHGCGCVHHPMVPRTVREAQDMLTNGRIYLDRKFNGEVAYGSGESRGLPLVPQTA